MKKVLIALSMFMAFSIAGANSANAQNITTGDQVLAAARNLLNVQVGSVNVTASDVIDVSNVLNNNIVTVTALNDILNGITIDNVLNNTLRDANIIKNNQVVVGVLTNGTNVSQVLVAKPNLLRKKK